MSKEYSIGLRNDTGHILYLSGHLGHHRVHVFSDPEDLDKYVVIKMTIPKYGHNPPTIVVEDKNKNQLWPPKNFTHGEPGSSIVPALSENGFEIIHLNHGKPLEEVAKEDNSFFFSGKIQKTETENDYSGSSTSKNTYWLYACGCGTFVVPEFFPCFQLEEENAKSLNGQGGVDMTVTSHIELQGSNGLDIKVYRPE